MAQGGASAGAPAQASSGGGNPFQLASNWYAEKNNQGGTSSFTVGSNQGVVSGSINAGQYMRGIRLLVRTLTAGTAGTVAGTTDFPFNMLTQVDLVNVDGSEILYNMGGFSHYVAHKYSRPWQGDPAMYPDANASTALSPQFTLFLQPEIRWTAGCLANTDTRSQYRFDATIDTAANMVQGSGTAWSTGPVIAVTGYMDAWAQPDDKDLQGTPNQPVPPGLNLQVKRRHQIFTLNAANSDNILQSALTGNALRNQVFITRTTANNTRADLFTDPIQWQVDNRSMGKFSTQVASTFAAGSGFDAQWLSEFYSEYFPSVPVSSTANGYRVSTSYAPWSRELGVYVFPRFVKPGTLEGQGWLYTANNTKEIFETSTSTAYSSSATAELISDEVYPVGPVDPALTDI
jgi:hypothetical protein